MNAETFSAGLAHKFFMAAEGQGYTPTLMNQLAENPTLIGQVLEVQQGRAKIVAAAPPSAILPVPLLVPVGMFDVPATEEPLVLARHLVVNVADDAPIKMSGLGDNVRRWFLPLVEPAFPGSRLRIARLARRATATQMADALGGDLRATTTFTEILALMRAQRDGGSGLLRTDGGATVFPRVRDATGVLRQVFVSWYGVGWDVDAYEASYPSGWNAEDHVVSRDSR